MQKSLPDTQPAATPQTSAQDQQTCRTLMRGGSRTFFAAALLLPRRVHQPATALYAFCRLADDAIDDCTNIGPTAKPDALAHLRTRLDHAYAGTPLPIAADRAFAHAIHHHAIPRTLPEALLEGFEWDSQGRRYNDLDALYDYAARVAGTVGAMMALLMGARTPQALARACDLGIAMQLTNIARDIGEDARAGRLYLPLTWMHEAGIDPDAWLRNPVFTPQIASVAHKLLQSADALYTRAAAGIAHLPADCRPGIRAAGLIYAAIGHRIAAQGYDSVTARAHVPASHKAALLARSLAAIRPRAQAGHMLPLPAATYLVDAASCHEAPVPRTRFAPGRALETRVAWLFDLFERLDERRLETT